MNQGKKGQIQILATTQGIIHPTLLQMVEVAGRTCYKSADKITDNSATGFVRGIVKSGHESVIEHSWIVFKLTGQETRDNVIMELFLANNLLSITQGENYYLASGNLRMFRDLFKAHQPSTVTDAMLSALKQRLPVFFEDFQETASFNNPDVVIDPQDHQWTPKEKLAHWSATVRFQYGSRTMTHQLVRHRPFSPSQESQRYCDEQDFYESDYFVVPPSIEANPELKEFYLQVMTELSQKHKTLVKMAKEAGLTKVREDARFILPNAVCSEIVITGNLKEWFHFFKMRCESHAQWEIRESFANKILSEFKQIFPGVFDRFQFSEDGTKADLIKS
ncbi:MAG: FAD-dependent thymidylate synthase [bacterium]